MLPHPESYRVIFKSSASVNVREGSVKVTANVAWHCSFPASVKIGEGSEKIAVKVQVCSVTFDDCYGGSVLDLQCHKDPGRCPQKVTIIQ